MISANLCDPAVAEPLRTFQHNTTTYVGVPHGSHCKLWITTDQPMFLTVIAENRNIISDRPIAAPGDSLLLSDYKQPISGGGGLGGFIPGFLRIGRSKPPQKQLRLYAFRVVLSSRKLADGGRPEASYEFHILCDEDYNWAELFHLELQSRPAAIAPATIGDVAEGTCPICAEVRARLRREWLNEE